MEGPLQHGFRKAHSTTTALLEIQSYISKSLDAGLSVIVYSVDLSAAFDLLRADTFDDIIGRKLSEGLRFAILDFLSGRNFVVNIDIDIDIVYFTLPDNEQTLLYKSLT